MGGGGVGVGVRDLDEVRDMSFIWNEVKEMSSFWMRLADERLSELPCITLPYQSSPASPERAHPHEVSGGESASELT